MMFKKYISKISNTIGTVNYLQQKTIEKKHRVPSRHQSMFDDGYDVVDVDPSTINKMEIDISASGSRRQSMLDAFPENAQIILSAAIAKLRNTLFYYPLVYTFSVCYLLYSLFIFLFISFILFSSIRIFILKRNKIIFVHISLQCFDRRAYSVVVVAHSQGKSNVHRITKLWMGERETIKSC